MLPLVLIGGGLAVAGVMTWREHRRQRREAQAAPGRPPAAAGVATRTVTQVQADLAGREKEANHHIKVSAVAMATAALGELLYPPLLLISIPLSLYSALPVFRAACKSLFVERRLRASVADSISIAGSLAAGYFIATALCNEAYFLAQRLLAKTEDHSTQRMANLFGEQPRSAWVLRDGVEVEIPFASVDAGDLVVVNAGEVIPVDGRIEGGTATVDQHRLTGESQPVEKAAGDRVLAATLLVAGRLVIRVEKAGRDTVAAGIGDILLNTADYRATVEARSVRVADRLVLPILGASGAALVTLGPVSAVAVTNCNITEMVRFITPVGVLNHLHLASERGILIKDGRSLELLNGVDTVVFDKTGTLTLEQPHLARVHVWGGLGEDELLRLAAAAEHRQSHPIARAILEAAAARGLEPPVIDEARYEVGYGIKVVVDEGILYAQAGQPERRRTVRVGSLRFMEMERVQLVDDAYATQEECHDGGHTLVFVALNGQVAGALELHATPRPEAAATVRALKLRGLELYLLSGDHERPTRELAARLGIPHYLAGTLPEQKARHIERLQADGRSVCFVGDGINDTIAMKRARVSISLCGATTAATDTAGIVLMDRTLEGLAPLFELADEFRGNTRTGLGLALVPGLAGIGGVFLFHLGIYSTVVLFLLSLSAGTANAMLPLLKAAGDGRGRERRDRVPAAKET